MKLAIVGYGKMGRMVEQFAAESGFTVHSRLDVHDDLMTAKGADVAIEFSAPHAAIGNIRALAKAGVPTVVGTTGWLEHLDEARAIVDAAGTGLVWGSNFSIGVNVFMRVVAEAAKLLKNEPQYGAWSWEIHHNTKKDAPSGTAISLVRAMQEAGYKRDIDQSSNRAGAHPGTHEIGFDSPADTITLRHTARSREGFARGALKAAQWLPGKKGVFEFKDIVFS